MHVSDGNCVFLYTGIPTLLVLDPLHKDLVVAQELVLPLGQFGYFLVNENIIWEPMLVGDLHPEVPAGEVLKYSLLSGIMIVPLGLVTSENILEYSVYF